MKEEEKLADEARRSREETRKLREESEPSRGEPWAKTSSGDADSVTTDDDED